MKRGVGGSGKVRLNVGLTAPTSPDVAASGWTLIHKEKKVSSTSQLTEWRRLLKFEEKVSVVFFSHTSVHIPVSPPRYLHW